MAKTKNATKVVVVTGDVTMDWNLARTRIGEGGGAAWNADHCTHAYWQRGGAALLADLIEAVGRRLHDSGQANYEVRQMGAPKSGVGPGQMQYHHSYAIWSQFDYSAKAPLKSEKRAWRVEEYLGLDRCRIAGDSQTAEWKKVVNDTQDADLVVLDDAGLGFRKEEELWPLALKVEQRRPWILLKMARPVAQGTLWDYLHRNCAEQLIVVMTVNDLRLTEVQISRELSWERTAQDLAWELVHNPLVNALSRSAHVVISFATAGAFLLSRSDAKGKEASDRIAPKCSLFFDPEVIEGVWGLDFPGGMIGYTTCLAAGIVRQLMFSPEAPDIHRGIQSGLVAMRALHREGYGRRGTHASEAALAFPTTLIADELVKEEAPFTVAEVQDPVRFLSGPADSGGKPPEASFWTILQDRYSENLDQVARLIVLKGADVAVKGVPLGQFGDLLTVDRREIESFRSIAALVGEYIRQGLQKPLSIAVFGAPGSGKSFGILEVAKSMLPDRIQKLEFNLSQFRRSEELLDAFHQVRDLGLTGKIPLVFWDEFDTSLGDKELGWLAYFLAPMQDGKFQQGQITHPIGTAIFVFAGGTSESIEQFRTAHKEKDFREVKGPDFVSRIKGYVNILGPNPSGGNPAGDPYFLIRRALLLRSIFRRNRPQLFGSEENPNSLNIDSGVLRAFLHVRKYKHGARSMESLVAMSALTGKTSFERSCLPAEEQLNLHADGLEFLALVQQIELEGDLLERLAEAAHEIFCAGKVRGGYTWGRVKSAVEKTTPLLVPYAELPEIYKESNRTTVRTIPKKLAAAGYVMIPSRSNEPPLEFPGDDLEKLARYEHELWMADRLAAGFTLGEPTPANPKRNEYLVPWEQVPEGIKETDRDLIRGIPGILSRAGYTIVKAHGERA